MNESIIASAIGHTAELDPQTAEIAAFLEDLNKETARGAALIAPAFIDEQLKRIISAFLMKTKTAQELLEDGAPLGEFSARIKIVHAMGLITDDERHDCDAVRRVRNRFAHLAKMSFEDEKVKAYCSSMKYNAALNKQIGPRGAFTTVAVGMIARLSSRAFHAGESALTKKEWPI